MGSDRLEAYTSIYTEPMIWAFIFVGMLVTAVLDSLLIGLLVTVIGSGVYILFLR